MKQPKQKICRNCKTEMQQVETTFKDIIKYLFTRSLIYFAFVIGLDLLFNNDTVSTVLSIIYIVYGIVIAILHDDDCIETYKCKKCNKVKMKINPLSAFICFIMHILEIIF